MGSYVGFTARESVACFRGGDSCQLTCVSAQDMPLPCTEGLSCSRSHTFKLVLSNPSTRPLVYPLTSGSLFLPPTCVSQSRFLGTPTHMLIDQTELADAGSSLGPWEL